MLRPDAGPRAATGPPAGSTASASTAPTTTTRCGSAASSSASRPPSTPPGIGFGSRVSPTNYVANHIGNFAAGTEAVCRSLFFGGVPTPLPGAAASPSSRAAWRGRATCSPTSSATTRSATATAIAHYDPRNLDRAQLERAASPRYGPSGLIAERRDRLDETLGFLSDPDEDPADLDEFAASGIGSVGGHRRGVHRAVLLRLRGRRPDERHGLRQPPSTRQGARLRAMFASDIGHWDVPDFTGVLPEAWELVEDEPRRPRPVPRLHVRQRRVAVRGDEPELLRRHPGRDLGARRLSNR